MKYKPLLTPNKFDKYANCLMNKYILNFNGIKFRICEIEFYLYNDDHQDVFTHKHPQQLETGTFYFHQMSKTKPHSYKGGTYKGMDITFGKKDSYCGILIRSLRNLKTNELIEGPSKCVDAILKCFNAESILNLVTKIWKNNVKINDYLKEYDLDKKFIYTTTRIGLRQPNDFLKKRYRYLIEPMIKKNRKELKDNYKKLKS